MGEAVPVPTIPIWPFFPASDLGADRRIAWWLSETVRGRFRVLVAIGGCCSRGNRIGNVSTRLCRSRHDDHLV